MTGVSAKRDSVFDLNKVPISYKANRMIGDKAPSDYLRQLQSHKSVGLSDGEMDAVLKTHCLDPEPLRQNDYDGFIETRRRLLLERIAAAMGKPFADSGEVVADDDGEGEVGAQLPIFTRAALGWSPARRRRVPEAAKAFVLPRRIEARQRS